MSESELRLITDAGVPEADANRVLVDLHNGNAVPLRDALTAAGAKPSRIVGILNALAPSSLVKPTSAPTMPAVREVLRPGRSAKPLTGVLGRIMGPSAVKTSYVWDKDDGERVQREGLYIPAGPLSRKLAHDATRKDGDVFYDGEGTAYGRVVGPTGTSVQLLFPLPEVNPAMGFEGSLYGEVAAVLPDWHTLKVFDALADAAMKDDARDGGLWFNAEDMARRFGAVRGRRPVRRIKNSAAALAATTLTRKPAPGDDEYRTVKLIHDTGQTFKESTGKKGRPAIYHRLQWCKYARDEFLKHHVEVFASTLMQIHDRAAYLVGRAVLLRARAQRGRAFRSSLSRLATATGLTAGEVRHALARLMPVGIAAMADDRGRVAIQLRPDTLRLPRRMTAIPALMG